MSPGAHLSSKLYSHFSTHISDYFNRFSINRSASINSLEFQQQWAAKPDTYPKIIK